MWSLRWKRLVWAGLITCWFAGITYIAYAQDLSRELDRMRLTVEDNTRRIVRIEELKDVAARIAVLEDNMFEIKWLSRTVAAALVVQLFVNGVTFRRRDVEDR